MADEADWLPIKAAAYVAGVSPKTIRRWIDAGRLPAVEVGPTRRVRVRQTVLEAVMRPRPHGAASEGD